MGALTLSLVIFVPNLCQFLMKTEWCFEPLWHQLEHFFQNSKA